MGRRSLRTPMEHGRQHHRGWCDGDPPRRSRADRSGSGSRRHRTAQRSAPGLQHRAPHPQQAGTTRLVGGRSHPGARAGGDRRRGAGVLGIERRLHSLEGSGPGPAGRSDQLRPRPGLDAGRLLAPGHRGRRSGPRHPLLRRRPGPRPRRRLGVLGVPHASRSAVRRLRHRVRERTRRQQLTLSHHEPRPAVRGRAPARTRGFFRSPPRAEDRRPGHHLRSVRSGPSE